MFCGLSHLGKASIYNAHYCIVDISCRLGGINTGMDAFLLVVTHQWPRLLVVGFKPLTQGGFGVIRPFDKGLPRDLISKQYHQPAGEAEVHYSHHPSWVFLVDETPHGMSCHWVYAITC